MADVHRSATDDRDQASPFARPAFLGAGALVLVIVLLGLFLVVRVARSNDTSAPPPPVTASPVSTPSASTSAPPADSQASVCGLPGNSGAGSITAPPAVTWGFQGSTGYPRSPEFGPGKTAPEGYRYCFQHSSAGAVVMAANALVQGSDPATGQEWANYALGSGRYRSQLADQLGKPTGAEGTRLKIAGFRVLSFTTTSARVDLAVRVSSQNQNLIVSGVYELAWEDGDWKINADIERPLDTATIPDLTGYVPWGE